MRESRSEAVPEWAGGAGGTLILFEICTAARWNQRSPQLSVLCAFVLTARPDCRGFEAPIEPMQADLTQSCLRVGRLHTLPEVTHRFRRQKIVLSHFKRPWCELAPLQTGLDLKMLPSLTVGLARYSRSKFALPSGKGSQLGGPHLAWGI